MGPDPSRSAERTGLAWQRTLMAAALLALVPLHDLGRTGGVLVAAAVLTVALLVVVRRPLPLLVAAAVALDCALALATALTPGGSR